MTEIRLSAGRLRLALSPAIGGAIAAFERVGDGESRPILRPTPSPLGQVLDAASFPLVPYVNRIRGGRFEFRGRMVHLEPNMAGDSSPLHGQGWLNPWGVERQDEQSATFVYRHEAGEWPWSYEARQEFELDENGLSVTLTCRNVGEEPMPCGLGHHPYFPCTPETRLDTQVDHAWTIDDKVLPLDKVPAVGVFDLRDRLICGQKLDNGFGGWGGEARMSDPEWPFELRMTSKDAHFFQVYSPPGGGIFVAEPVTHANAALNSPESEWADLGMQVLEPGEAMVLHMHLEVLTTARQSA
jgi:aldose 1-epimerase